MLKQYRADAAVDWSNLKMIDEPSNPWNVMSGLLNNGDSSWSTVTSWLQKIPPMIDTFVKTQPGCPHTQCVAYLTWLVKENTPQMCQLNRHSCRQQHWPRHRLAAVLRSAWNSSSTSRAASSTGRFLYRYFVFTSPLLPSRFHSLQTVDNMANILSALAGETSKCGQACDITAFNDTARQVHTMGDYTSAALVLQQQYTHFGNTDIYA